jgi:hypothetical protein
MRRVGTTRVEALDELEQALVEGAGRSGRPGASWRSIQ